MNNEKRKTVKKYSIKELRKVCQSTAPNPARESKLGKFSRIFSMYFTKFFLGYTRLTPTHLNILSVVVFLAGVSLFTLNTLPWNLVASALIFLSIVFDGCDGEMARFLECTSGFAGAYNEPVSHDVEYGLMFIPITIGLHLSGFSVWYVFAGFLASIFKLMERSLRIRFLFSRTYITDTTQDSKNFKDTYHQKPWYIRSVYWLEKNFYSSTGVFLVLFFFTLIDKLEYSVIWFSIGWGFFWSTLLVKQFYQIYSQKLLSK